jgi:NitT/TauT family transport system substrate-binding protein
MKRSPLPLSARVLLLALGLSSFACPCAAQTPTPLRFQHDWRIDGTVAIYELAQARGYFKQENLAVTIDAGPGSAATVNRLASGSYDMGQGDVLSLMEFRESNPALKERVKAIFQLWDELPAAVLVLKKSGIRTPADLRGKRIAAPLFDGGRKLFPLFAKANGLNPEKDVNWITVEPALREQMLTRGNADAITAYSFALVNLNRMGVKDDEVLVMRYGDHGVHVLGTTILASTAFAQAHPGAVKGFLRAVSRALKDAIADPASAIRLVKQREPLIDEALELKRLKLIIADGYDSKRARAGGIGAVDKGDFEKSIGDISAAYGLKSAARFDDLFDLQYLPAKEARLVFGQ